MFVFFCHNASAPSGQKGKVLTNLNTESVCTYLWIQAPCTVQHLYQKYRNVLLPTAHTQYFMIFLTVNAMTWCAKAPVVVSVPFISSRDFVCSPEVSKVCSIDNEAPPIKGTFASKPADTETEAPQVILCKT